MIRVRTYARQEVILCHTYRVMCVDRYACASFGCRRVGVLPHIIIIIIIVISVALYSMWDVFIFTLYTRYVQYSKSILLTTPPRRVRVFIFDSETSGEETYVRARAVRFCVLSNRTFWQTKSISVPRFPRLFSSCESDVLPKSFTFNDLTCPVD